MYMNIVFDKYLLCMINFRVRWYSWSRVKYLNPLTAVSAYLRKAEGYFAKQFIKNQLFVKNLKKYIKTLRIIIYEV